MLDSARAAEGSMLLLGERLKRWQGPMCTAECIPQIRGAPRCLIVMQPMECPEPVPSPFAQCPGMGCAGERATQRISPCPPYVPLPATQWCYSEQLQEIMNTAWQFASASLSGRNHHIMHFPRKHHGCDREGSKFFVLETSH